MYVYIFTSLRKCREIYRFRCNSELYILHLRERVFTCIATCKEQFSDGGGEGTAGSESEKMDTQ